MPTRVEDPSDARLANYRQLRDPARQTLEAQQRIFVVEGRLAVGQLLRSSYRVLSLLVDEHQASAAAGLVTGVEAAGAPVFVATRAVLERTVGFDLHRGVVALGHRPDPAEPSAVVAGVLAAACTAGRRGVLAVLEGVNDHENLGAIFRNAAAFGAGAVLLDPSCADPLYRRSVRVSLGHVLSVPFARLASWPDDLERLVASSGVVLAALAPEHSARAAGAASNPVPLPEWAAERAATPGVAILLGAEGTGLSAAASSAAQEVVSIPIAEGVDSLNVATAQALALYELATRWPRSLCVRD